MKRILLTTFIMFAFCSIMMAAPTIPLAVDPQDVPLIYYILAIIGLICCGVISENIESKLFSLIVSVAGGIMIAISVVGMGYSFWGGLAMGGLMMCGGCYVYKKIKGEFVLVDVKWLNLIVGLIFLVGGGFLWIE